MEWNGMDWIGRGWDGMGCSQGYCEFRNYRRHLVPCLLYSGTRALVSSCIEAERLNEKTVANRFSGVRNMSERQKNRLIAFLKPFGIVPWRAIGPGIGSGNCEVLREVLHVLGPVAGQGRLHFRVEKQVP